MASWADMALDSLAAAKGLRAGGHVRSCLSRAYYSAYAAVTAELPRDSIGSAGRSNPTHLQLAKMAKHNLDPARFGEPVRRDVARRLRRLQSLRIAADYDPEGSLDVSDAAESVMNAEWIVRTVGRARG